MKTENRKIYQDRGVTMIALTVTIVVLIIIATISIDALTGDSGIVDNARDAKSEAINAQIKQDIEFSVVTNTMSNGEIMLAQLKKDLEDKGATILNRVDNDDDGQIDKNVEYYDVTLEKIRIRIDIKTGEVHYYDTLEQAAKLTIENIITIHKSNNGGNVDVAILKEELSAITKYEITEPSNAILTLIVDNISFNILYDGTVEAINI